MKFEILLIVLLSRTVKATRNGDLVKIEEEGSGMNNSDTLNILMEKINIGSKKRIDDTESWEGSGKDDEDTESSGSGMDKDESSGSGEPIQIIKVSSSTTPTVKTTPDYEVPTSFMTSSKPKEEISTGKVDVINYVTEVSTTKKIFTDKKDDGTTKGKKDMTTVSITVSTDSDNSVEKIPDNGVVQVEVDDNDIFVAKSQGDDNKEGKEDKGVNFTVGIIVAVVVGAILSILIIVFLVYRLRKKDEGSYSLDEPLSAMLRADSDTTPIKGKETATPLIV